MLPGLRFLFAAIMLCFSIVVFGLGAAALLKSAHEEFANRPSLRGAPEITFAQPVDSSQPVIALLRVEPARPDPQTTASDTAIVSDQAGTSDIAERPVIAETPPDEPSRVASLTTAAREPSDAIKPELPRIEAVPAPSKADDEPASTGSIDARATPAAQNAVRVEPGTPTAPETVENVLGEGSIIVENPATLTVAAADQTATTAPRETAASEPASRTEPDPIAAKLASLGDTPQTNVAETPETRADNAAEAAAERRALKRQQRARRAKERRRLASARRARVEQGAPAQQDPFAPPFGSTTQQPPANFRPIQPAQSQ